MYVYLKMLTKIRMVEVSPAYKIRTQVKNELP